MIAKQRALLIHVVLLLAVVVLNAGLVGILPLDLTATTLLVTPLVLGFMGYYDGRYRLSASSLILFALLLVAWIVAWYVRLDTVVNWSETWATSHDAVIYLHLIGLAYVGLAGLCTTVGYRTGLAFAPQDENDRRGDRLDRITGPLRRGVEKCFRALGQYVGRWHGWD
ncbi:MAG: hypothetical protein ACOC93_05775 [Planctomycetota bacterium]